MIEIRFSEQGLIRLDPGVWLREKGTLGNFRRMLKLSAVSDRCFGTEVLSAWEDAVRERYQQLGTWEPAGLHGAELGHKARLQASVAWQDQHLRKEEERFRRQKIHRRGSKSHAERLQEIDAAYRRMLAAEEKRYAAELTRIRKRSAKARELCRQQLLEIEKIREAMIDVDEPHR